MAEENSRISQQRARYRRNLIVSTMVEICHPSVDDQILSDYQDATRSFNNSAIHYDPVNLFMIKNPNTLHYGDYLQIMIKYGIVLRCAENPVIRQLVSAMRYIVRDRTFGQQFFHPESSAFDPYQNLRLGNENHRIISPELIRAYRQYGIELPSLFFRTFMIRITFRRSKPLGRQLTHVEQSGSPRQRISRSLLQNTVDVALNSFMLVAGKIYQEKWTCSVRFCPDCPFGEFIN